MIRQLRPVPIPFAVLSLAVLSLAACAAAPEASAPAPDGPAARATGADTVHLLIRSDDAGMTHSVNQATERLIESGVPVSVSIMFPTPWWQEMVEILRQHPDVSVGIHLTLNSEWKDYRWGPIIGATAAPSLVDEHGYFFSSARDLYENDPDLGEVERELRAQIERAVGTGLQIDYVDFHMGTARSHPPFLEIVRRLAGEYGLLMSGFHDEESSSPQYRAAPADKPDSLAALVARIDARYNVVITHPGLNTPELAALRDMNVSAPLAEMAMHRQGELDALLSREFRRAVRERGVRLITYRDLRSMLPPGRRPDAAAGPARDGRTFLAVFAHPDDERIVAPMLARLAREGHDVRLVVATDGSKGVTEHGGIPAGQALARARADETRCATRALGIAPPVLLGLEDGGLATFENLGRLREELRRIVAEVRPDAIVTFGPEGGTGHPDHRLVGVVTTEVVQSGGAGVTDALYYASLPAERMESAPPARPHVTPMPARHLTVAVPFEPRDLDAGVRAFACHATQYTPEQQAAVNRYLAHGFEGAVRLRPWYGARAGGADPFP